MNFVVFKLERDAPDIPAVAGDTLYVDRDARPAVGDLVVVDGPRCERFSEDMRTNTIGVVTSIGHPL